MHLLCNRCRSSYNIITASGQKWLNLVCAIKFFVNAIDLTDPSNFISFMSCPFKSLLKYVRKFHITFLPFFSWTVQRVIINEQHMHHNMCGRQCVKALNLPNPSYPPIIENTNMYARKWLDKAKFSLPILIVRHVVKFLFCVYRLESMRSRQRKWHFLLVYFLKETRKR